MNKTSIAILFALVAISTAAIVKRQAQTSYTLPDGAELVVGSIQSTFNCEGRIYGYYADVSNRCQIFHVCVPVVLADGQQQTSMYSFFCGNQTVFDQSALVCQHPQDALPCEQAESFYSINDSFGKTDRPFRV